MNVRSYDSSNIWFMIYPAALWNLNKSECDAFKIFGLFGHPCTNRTLLIPAIAEIFALSCPPFVGSLDLWISCPSQPWATWTNRSITGTGCLSTWGIFCPFAWHPAPEPWVWPVAKWSSCSRTAPRTPPWSLAPCTSPPSWSCWKSSSIFGGERRFWSRGQYNLESQKHLRIAGQLFRLITRLISMSKLPFKTSCCCGVLWLHFMMRSFLLTRSYRQFLEIH